MHDLKLYHAIISVCAQKVRVALADKGLAYDEQVMSLRGDQFEPEYLKLNPNALVPTLASRHADHRIDRTCAPSAGHRRLPR